MADKLKKALIVLDDSNIYYGLKKSGWELDYQKLYDWFHKEFVPIAITFYGGIISKKTFFDRHPTHTLSGFIKAKKAKEAFLDKLKEIGYKVVSKPVESVYDSTSATFKRKCNFDVEITIDVLDKLNNYEELVLCSGDGDFVKLGKYIKGKFKKFTVIAHKDRLNTKLAKTANRTIFFRNLKSIIEKKKELP